MRDGMPLCHHRPSHHWICWLESWLLPAACSPTPCEGCSRATSQTDRTVCTAPCGCRNTRRARRGFQPERSAHSIRRDTDDDCTRLSEITNKFFTQIDRQQISDGYDAVVVAGPVSIWMGDRLWTGKPSRYVTSHPCQLSLAIPLCVGAVSTSKSWGINGHTA